MAENNSLKKTSSYKNVRSCQNSILYFHNFILFTVVSVSPKFLQAHGVRLAYWSCARTQNV